MTAHKHAALMLLYAQDAAETDEPWKRWEQIYRDEWTALHCSPVWREELSYRRKPKTIRIGEFDVPEPLRHAPALGTAIYWPMLYNVSLTNGNNWHAEGWQQRSLLSGMLHLTEKAAELHTKALLSLTKVTP